MNEDDEDEEEDFLKDNLILQAFIPRLCVEFNARKNLIDVNG